ncbi:PABS domain-containing protein [Trichostrongylus colubriformis]|uniref:PABS domain-containing protein n=1 Tax=Trichostrongylus colubriformis TaxID=6319 RepID=A0AAN8ISH9_TRICO
MLHHFFPEMDVTVVEYNAQMISMAKKWFGLELNAHHRVKLDDGIKFIMEEVKLGSNYDMVFLDACDSRATDAETICPVTGFLDDKVVEGIAQLVGLHGLFLEL